MRSYITVVDGDIDLLPFFADYYARVLGVTEFFLINFGTDIHRENARKILAAHAEVILGKQLPAHKFLAGTRDRYIRKIHPKGQWAFVSDMDEFPDIDTQEAIRLAEENNEVYVAGLRIDRASATGELKDIQPNKKLVEQFPMQVPSHKVSKAPRSSYILVKNGKFGGSHPSTAKKHWPPKKVWDVHHFKWFSTVIRRLTTRRKRVKGIAGGSWAKRIHRQIVVLRKHNGVPKKFLRPIEKDIDI